MTIFYISSNHCLCVVKIYVSQTIGFVEVDEIINNYAYFTIEQMSIEI